MAPYIILSLLFLGALPALASSPDSPQTVLSASSFSANIEQQASTSNFSSPFNPREYERYQHMARCTAINRSSSGQHNVKEIQLRELRLIMNAVASFALHGDIDITLKTLFFI